VEVKEGYKKTEAGVIPSDWAVEAVGDFGQVITGGTPSTEIKEYWGGEVPWVTPTDISDKKDIIYTEREITFSGLNAIRKLPRNSVLVTCIASIGKNAILRNDGSCNQQINAIIPNDEHDCDFLYYLFENNKQYLLGHAGITATNIISKKDFSEIQFAIPSRSEQTAIATALSDTDNLIQSLEKLITKKQSIKQGAMQELLTPKEGWAVKRLPKVCWFQEGPGVRNSQFTSSGVKLLNGTNIEKGKLLLAKTDRYISEKEAYGWYSHFLADKGDIVIACSGITVEKFQEKVTTLGKEHLPLCMNTSTMRFKITAKELTKDYLFHFLKSKSFKEQIGGKATGSAQLNFGPSHVRMVEISLPEPEKQKAITQVLTDIDTDIETLEKKLNKYKMIKQGMMQELLTGKTRLV